MMTSSEKMLTSAILCNQKNFWLYFWKEDRLKIIPAKFRCIWINNKKIIKGGSNRPPPQPTHAQKSPTVVGLNITGEKVKLTFFLIFLKTIILFGVVQKDQIKQRSVPKSVTDEVVSVLKIIKYKNANMNFFSLNLSKIFF